MEQIAIEKVGARWIARTSYAQREIPKSAGFRWDREKKCWYTTDEAVVVALSDPEAAAKLKAQREAAELAKQESIAASRAQDSEAEIPVPDGLAYLPYQKAGIAFALDHPNVLIGDEMGLGKTIQAIGILNSDHFESRISHLPGEPTTQLGARDS